ncbi:hypothetical protein CKOHBEJN_00526 [Aeromonas hydrophila]
MRDSLKQKIIQVCHQKIAQKGEAVGVSFYAFLPTATMIPSC